MNAIVGVLLVIGFPLALMVALWVSARFLYAPNKPIAASRYDGA